jgi:hypothetical protein
MLRPSSRHLKQSTSTRSAAYPSNSIISKPSVDCPLRMFASCPIGWQSWHSPWREASLTRPTRYHEAHTISIELQLSTSWRLQRHDLILLFSWTVLQHCIVSRRQVQREKLRSFVFFTSILLDRRFSALHTGGCLYFWFCYLFSLVSWPGCSSFFCFAGNVK